MSGSRFKSALSKLFNKNKELRSKISGLIGHKISNIEIYEVALTHRSLSADKTSNERLEFLGDALLNLVISEYLYNSFPDHPEGELSKLRTKLINRKLLNKVAIEMHLDELVSTRIGEKDNPKFIYGNALEALIGAVYIDRGLQRARDFIIQKVFDLNRKGSRLLEKEYDYKSLILEWSARYQKQVIIESYEKDSKSSGYVAVIKLNGDKVAEGSGSSKKGAEQEACSKFWKDLKD